MANSKSMSIDEFLITTANVVLSKHKNPKNPKNDKTKVVKRSRKKTSREPLQHHYNTTPTIECGIDEAGRGPLFGRVYTACVILPYDEPELKYELIKDSKRFSSKRKLLEVYDYILENAIDYSVAYKDETYIDEHNILYATQTAMHDCIKTLRTTPEYLLVDGNYFIPYKHTLENGDKKVIQYSCFEGGDNLYCSIAAASILAKVERDMYIEKMCDDNPELDEYYSLNSNKGYGTKKHMEGIREYGISKWHRKSFGICKKSPIYNE